MRYRPLFGSIMVVASLLAFASLTVGQDTAGVRDSKSLQLGVSG